MNEPKVQTEDPPVEGASPGHNPTGDTPHGIPKGIKDDEPKGLPHNDRGATETAPLNDKS